MDVCRSECDCAEAPCEVTKMENKKNKLNKEELKEYLESYLKRECEWVIRDCLREGHDEAKIKSHLADKMYDAIINSIPYNDELHDAKRSEKFDKDSLREWIKGAGVKKQVEKTKAKMAANKDSLYLSRSNEEIRDELKKSITKSVILNPDIDKKEITKTICDDYLKKAQEREEKVESLEDDLKKTVGLLYAQIADESKDLYKNIYNAVEEKTYGFPHMYTDAFAILEFIRQGGHFNDPHEAMPVKYADIKPGIEQSEGDGDVASKE